LGLIFRFCEDLSLNSINKLFYLKSRDAKISALEITG